MITIDFNKQNEKRIIIKGKCETFRANVKDITHIVCDAYLSTIYATTGRKFSVSHSLKNFEDNLKEEDGFVRVNRNILINTEHVISTKHKEKKLNVNGIDIKASRDGFAQLKKMFYC